MNPYSILPLIAFVVNIVLGLFILSKSPKNKMSQAYAVFSFALASWALMDYFIFTAETAAVAMQLDRARAMGILFSPACVFCFALIFTKRKVVSIEIIKSFLFLITLFFLIIRFKTDLIVKSMSLEYWGYGLVPGALYPLLLIYVVGLFIASVFLIYLFYLKTKSNREKKQAKFLLIAFAVSLLSGGISEGIFPVIGIAVVPLASTSTTIMAIIIFYSIVKYQLMLPVSISSMKIRTKIMFPVMVCLVLSLVFASGFVYFFAKENMTKQVHSNLKSVAYSKTSRIQYFLEENKEAIKQFSKGFVFSELLTTNKSNEEYSQKFKATNKRLKEIEKSGKYVFGIFVMDKNGIIVASSEDTDIGKNKSKDPYFLSGKHSVFVKEPYISQDRRVNAIAFSAPISDNEGKFLGVIAMRVATKKYDEIILDSFGLGETEETYLVNRDGYMITSSKFKENTFLKQKVDTINTRNCFEDYEKHKTEECEHKIEMFSGYRGNKVLGAHDHISEMGWCLLTEIEEKEALVSVRELLFEIVLFVCFLLLFMYILLLWIAKKITKPIETLHRGTEIIEKGDLNHKVSIKTKDEIGQLSRAFDKMTRAVKKSRAEVDKKVGEQTKDIAEKQSFLRDQQKALLNILEDVEDEKELTAKEKDKISAILHSIGDGVFVVDSDLKITMFNQVAADISGFSIKEAIGKKYDNILKFIYEKDRKTNAKFIRDAISSGKIQEMANHTLLIRKDNSEIAVADSAAPLKNKEGDIFGCVVVFRDVTKEREIDQVKTEFVSLASHQLRTPLSAINWYTEMLMAGDAGKLNKEQLEYLKEVYNGNQRMVELVNALLNVSRLELGTFVIDPEMINITKIADNAVKELFQKITKKKIKFTNKYGKNIAKLNLDKKLTHMIFQNLLSNAVKYTPEKGEVSLKISKVKNNIEITIADTGIGIPKSQQNKIFSKMFRADNVRTTDTQGTGLGLYIVKQILDQSGGSISFKSKEKEGTIFCVKIPLSGMKKKSGTKTLS